MNSLKLWRKTPTLICTLMLYLCFHGTNSCSLSVEDNTTCARRNFCDIEKQVRNHKLSLRDALRGLNISVGLMNHGLPGADASTVLNYENHKLSASFMDAISERAGFYWKDNVGVIENINNESWTEVVLSTIEEYDVIGDWFSDTIEQIEMGLHTTDGWYDASLIMIMAKNSTESTDPKSRNWFMDPFDTAIWIFIIAGVIFTSMTLYLVDFLQSLTKMRRMDHGFSENLFYGIMMSTGHYLYNHKKISARIISFSMSAMFLIISSLYTANLASFLVADSTATCEIANIDEAIELRLLICYDESNSEHTKAFFRNNYKSANTLPMRSAKACYRAVDTGVCDICVTEKSTWDINKQRDEFNPNCNLKWVGDIIFNYQGGFILKYSTDLCNNILEDVMSLYILEMIEDGSKNALWNNYLDDTKTISCPEESTVVSLESYTFTVEDLKTIFLFHYSLTILAVGIALTRYCRLPENDRRIIRKDIYLKIKGLGSIRDIDTDVNENAPEDDLHEVSNKDEDELSTSLLKKKEPVLKNESVTRNLYQLNKQELNDMFKRLTDIGDQIDTMTTDT